MKFILVNFCIVLYIFLVTNGCQIKRAEDHVEEGAALAKVRCAGCHMVPDPSLLDKKTWRNGVLPAMAVEFGIEVLQGNIYLNHKTSTISNHDWLTITSYYESLAPDSLTGNSKTLSPATGWAVFKLRKPDLDTAQTSGTLMSIISPGENAVYTSSLNKPGLYKWNHDLKPEMITALASPAVDIDFSHSQQKIITVMGGMRATDGTIGEVFSLSKKPNGDYIKAKVDSTFIRPLQSKPIDYNKDGLTDYVICSFGHTKGGLYILKQLKNHQFVKFPLREVPGATQSLTGDFNNDGWPDVMALFAHADEGIWLFTNDKKGGFETKNILRFPSVYGSSSFQLIDMNNDGKPDIVYTAGDNSDYSRILKPYHGLYVYLNNGNLTFKKSYFYPINGCTKAVATDFDQDGDMDVATIAFFADFKNNPAESFIYFENSFNGVKSTLNFKPIAIPVSKNGRWICMDVNDYDGDGDADVVLGNYSKGFLNEESFKPNWDVHTPFVILENKSGPK